MRSAEPRGLARGLAWLVERVLGHRLLAGLGLAALTVVALLGLTRLRVDFSSTSFYGDDSDAAADLASYQARWGPDDGTLLVLVEPRASDDPAGVVSAERIAAIGALAEALADAEGVEGVRSIATVELPRRGLRGGLRPVSFVSYAALFDLAEQSPQARAERLAELPIVPTLVAETGDSAVIAVELGFSSDDVLATRARVAALELVAAGQDEALAAAGLTRQFAGVPAIRASFVELVIHDQLRFVPLTLVVIGLCLGLSFRSIHGVLIPALAAALPTLILVGLMAWLDQAIGLLNQVYFTLLPIIAVADAVHMVARYHEARDELGPDAGAGAQHRAIVIAGSRVGVACLLTSLTTGAGFASLATASMPILRSFGLFAALGIVLAFLTMVVLVPLLLSLLAADPDPRELPGSRIVDAAVGLALRWPWACASIGLALSVVALIPARAVTVDNYLSDLLDADHPTSRASARIDAAHGGVLGLEFEVELGPELGPEDPAVLEATLGFERWLAAQPEVRTVVGFATIIAGSARLDDEDEGDEDQSGDQAIPPTRGGVEVRRDRVAPYAPLDELVDAEAGALRIHAGVPDVGGRAFVALVERAEAELEARLAQLPAPVAEAHATGTPLLAYRGVNGITTDLRRSFALVFAIVSILMIALFRSGWPALIALVPNGAPILIGYASLGLVGVVLDPLAGVILTLALGIAVDDSLHLLVRTREELAAGVELDAALRRGVGHSGRAVLVTTLILVAGLSLNLFASFPALNLLGLLGGVILSLALLFDLLVLPATIVILGGRGLGISRRADA